MSDKKIALSSESAISEKTDNAKAAKFNKDMKFTPPNMPSEQPHKAEVKQDK
jgi:hypothetical protein